MLKKIILLAIIVLLSYTKFFANPNDSIILRSNLKYIQPKTHSININILSPVLRASTNIFDEENLIESAIKSDGNRLNLNYQYNLTKNYFVETLLSYHSTQTTIGFNNYFVTSGSILQIESSKQNYWNLGLGGGYRFIGENHKRLMDINFGFNFIYTQNILGNTIFNDVLNYRVDNIDKSVEIRFTQKELNNFIVGAYLGVSKEFRLCKGIHLHVAYQHRFTPKFLSKDVIEYNFVNENLTGKVEAYNLNTRSFLMLGLKYYVAK
jgi:hypothetical protein